MSNPEGGRKDLAISLPVDGATTLTDLSLELILRIASQLGVRDLLALRKARFELENLKFPQVYQAKSE